MAVRAHCDQCQKSFSAQDEYLGKKIKCPGCGTKVQVLSPEEQAERDARRREQDERIQLLESLEERDRLRARGASYATEFGTGVDPVRNFNPGAVSRFRKLRALSTLMILAAYLLTFLVLGAGGVVIYLFVTGVITSPWLFSLMLIGIALVLVGCFTAFKFLGEFSWLLADIGDHQLDVRNLLLDLRDDVDRMKAKGAAAQEGQRFVGGDVLVPRVSKATRSTVGDVAVTEKGKACFTYLACSLHLRLSPLIPAWFQQRPLIRSRYYSMVHRSRERRSGCGVRPAAEARACRSERRGQTELLS